MSLKDRLEKLEKRLLPPQGPPPPEFIIEFVDPDGTIAPERIWCRLGKGLVRIDQDGNEITSPTT